MGGLGRCKLLLLLRNTLGNKLVELRLLLLLRLDPLALDGPEVAAALQAERSDKALDFGCLGVRLGIRVLLRLDLTADNELPDVILLRQVEEFADFGRALGSKTLGENVLG